MQRADDEGYTREMGMGVVTRVEAGVRGLAGLGLEKRI